MPATSTHTSGETCEQAERLRHYICPDCDTPVGNGEVAMKQLKEWPRGRLAQPEATGFFKFRKKKKETPSVICVGCE